MADQMLDVLHYYMEEDYFISSMSEAQQHSRVREIIYRELYQREYKYAISSDSKGRQYIDPTATEDDLSDVTAFSPTAKPYTPPTDFNPESPDPFGGVLDTPLG